MRGPNDMGGLPAGPIDTEAHDMTFWEKQIDAISQLLGRPECAILHSGENRRSIESLGDDVYRTLSYYERWTAGITRLLLEKGVLTQDEINQKIAALRAQYSDARQAGESTAKPKAKPRPQAKAKAKSKAKAAASKRAKPAKGKAAATKRKPARTKPAKAKAPRKARPAKKPDRTRAVAKRRGRR